MAAAESKTDVFPITLVSEVQRIPKQPNFHSMVSKHKIYAFIIYMDAETIYYKPVHLNERYQKHFIDTGANIKNHDHYEVKPWSFTARKLKIPLGDNLRKNIDTRTCFKYGTDFFLVKGCFTPGQRTVEVGQKHLYQIGAVQMVLYFVSPRKQIRRRQKLLPVKDQYQYSVRYLQAHTDYLIPEGTTYILYAIQKSYFAVHVIHADTQLPFPSLNPLRHIQKRPASADYVYARPVPTPMIDDAVLGEDDEEGVRKMPPPPPPPQMEYEEPPPPPQMEYEEPPPPPQMEYEEPPPEPILVDLESEPPAAASYHITIPSVPIEKTINVVSPNLVNWYQRHFK